VSIIVSVNRLAMVVSFALRQRCFFSAPTEEFWSSQDFVDSS
jgi:hypothetical protein